jgi:uncharacterized paraquat-inducible protein A
MPNHDDRDEMNDLPWEVQEALEDPEGPQECDLLATDDEVDTVPCPNCGAEIPEMADHCPRCSEWVVQGGDRPMSNRTLLIAAVVFLALLLIVYLTL